MRCPETLETHGPGEIERLNRCAGGVQNHPRAEHRLLDALWRLEVLRHLDYLVLPFRYGLRRRFLRQLRQAFARRAEPLFQLREVHRFGNAAVADLPNDARIVRLAADFDGAIVVPFGIAFRLVAQRNLAHDLGQPIAVVLLLARGQASCSKPFSMA